MKRRAQFVREFEPYVAHAVGRVSNACEDPTLRYSPCVRWEEGTDVEKEFWRALDEGRREEVRMGSTLAGPHRDEIELFINGMPVREYASQGQQKTLLVALKLAESRYLKDQKGETPLLLLDDIFGELDRDRNKSVLGLLEGVGQTFITVSDERLLPEDRSGAYKFFSVKAGRVTEAEVERVES
jgi:DNA replication and repair protein RecF